MLQMITRIFSHVEEAVEEAEEKARGPFVIVAILIYIGSLFMLARKVNPVTDLDAYLVKALAQLSIPFGIILLQEMFELVATISKSTMRSTSQQFEIVALVILRSFFKDFYKLNSVVAEGAFGEPVQRAVVKIVALNIIAVLIAVFNHLSKRAGIERRDGRRQASNRCKQTVVIGVVLAVFVYMLGDHGWSVVSFLKEWDIMVFISLVFTGMIIVDAVFFLWTIKQTTDFSTLMFDGGLVVSLILARFPLFTTSILAYSLAVVGVAFATAALYLFIRPPELGFLGNPQEDDVARIDVGFTNRDRELEEIREKGRAFLELVGVSRESLDGFGKICETLVENIIHYAYDGADHHPIDIGLAVCGNRLTVTISDEGKPFNPFRPSMHDAASIAWQRKVGGLGTHVVRNEADRVTYRRQDGRNIVTLLKVLDKS